MTSGGTEDDTTNARVGEEVILNAERSRRSPRQRVDTQG